MFLSQPIITPTVSVPDTTLQISCPYESLEYTNDDFRKVSVHPKALLSVFRNTVECESSLGVKTCKRNSKILNIQLQEA